MKNFIFCAVQGRADDYYFKKAREKTEWDLVEVKF